MNKKIAKGKPHKKTATKRLKKKMQSHLKEPEDEG
jgi:hypothetical protein